MYLTLFGNPWNVLSNSSLEQRFTDADNDDHSDEFFTALKLNASPHFNAIRNILLTYTIWVNICPEYVFLRLSVQESSVLRTPDPFYYESMPPYTPINLFPEVIAFGATGTRPSTNQISWMNLNWCIYLTERKVIKINNNSNWKSNSSNKAINRRGRLNSVLLFVKQLQTRNGIIQFWSWNWIDSMKQI